MDLKSEDIILKESIRLYSNIARWCGCKGRLSVDLVVYPSPHITWQFEVLGQKASTRLFQQHNLNMKNGITDPIKGYQFEIPEPHPSGFSQMTDGSVLSYRGYAIKVYSGNPNTIAHSFEFYFPNAKFQEVNISGQQQIRSRLEEGTDCTFVGESNAGRSIELNLDGIWTLRLVITQPALDWMKTENRSVGTLITSAGGLFTTVTKKAKKPTLTLKEALDRLGNLSLLLSYANDGYIGPFLIKGFRKQSGAPKLVSSCATSYLTTPIEQLGNSWVTYDSDLISYLKCFNSFTRMMSQSAWKDTFHPILSWYFQVTNVPKEWPIIANGAGAALERLSYVILVLDETDSNKRNKAELLFDITKQQKAKSAWQIGKKYGNNLSVTGKRLQLLLERIGITRSRYLDIDDVMDFLAVRNEATHPKPSGVSDNKKIQLLRKSIQWVDEVLLWRLGYSGNYLDRSKDYISSISPRYDLSLRDASW